MRFLYIDLHDQFHRRDRFAASPAEPNCECGFLSEAPSAKMRSQKYRKQPHAKVQAAGMEASKAIDTSGKSGAFLHHPAILSTPVAPQPCGASVAIAARHPRPPLELDRPTAAIARA